MRFITQEALAEVPFSSGGKGEKAAIPELWKTWQGVITQKQMERDTFPRSDIGNKWCVNWKERGHLQGVKKSSVTCILFSSLPP
jgi:hypothetical protein